MICSCYYEHNPLFYYRIHGKNALGRKVGLFKRIVDDFVFFFLSKSKHREYTKEFFICCKSLLPNESFSIIDIYLQYPKILKYKLKLIFDTNFCGSLEIWNRIRKAVLIVFDKL